MKFAIALIVAALLTVTGLAVSGSTADDGSGLVYSKCVACHSLKRVCRNLGKKDLAAWAKTNSRMVDMGMAATADELSLINNYLANAKPGDKDLCK